jgi:hypothetical protein
MNLQNEYFSCIPFSRNFHSHQVSHIYYYFSSKFDEYSSATYLSSNLKNTQHHKQTILGGKCNENHDTKSGGGECRDRNGESTENDHQQSSRLMETESEIEARTFG